MNLNSSPGNSSMTLYQNIIWMKVFIILNTKLLKRKKLASTHFVCYHCIYKELQQIVTVASLQL